MSRQVGKTYSIFWINIDINFSPQSQLVHEFFRILPPYSLCCSSMVDLLELHKCRIILMMYDR